MFKRILLGVLAVAVAYVLYVWITFPDVSRLVKEPPRTTAFMEARRAELRREGKDDHLDYRWVPYSRISFAWKEPILPVMPCTRTGVVRSRRMLMRSPP